MTHEIVDALNGIEKELRKMNEAKNPKEAHYKEVLNRIINYISAGESCSNTIEQLLIMGFEPDDLVNDFNFSKRDVEYCLNDEDGFKWK